MALNLCQHAFNQHKLQFIQNLFGLNDFKNLCMCSDGIEFKFHYQH